MSRKGPPNYSILHLSLPTSPHPHTPQWPSFSRSAGCSWAACKLSYSYKGHLGLAGECLSASGGQKRESGSMRPWRLVPLHLPQPTCPLEGSAKEVQELMGWSWRGTEGDIGQADSTESILRGRGRSWSLWKPGGGGGPRRGRSPSLSICTFVSRISSQDAKISASSSPNSLTSGCHLRGVKTQPWTSSQTTGGHMLRPHKILFPWRRWGFIECGGPTRLPAWASEVEGDQS